ncbi:Nn.00g064750.m01.CDS01 [Neocucurbitaria sp. VM-36]
MSQRSNSARNDNDRNDLTSPITRTRSRAKILARLEHLTWAWYTLPMSTGGLALLLSPKNQPNTFTALETIGKVVYVFDLFIFFAITCAMTFRLLNQPGLLKRSIAHPTEGLFFATFFLSIASIIGGIGLYGIPECGAWLVVVYRVLFWFYFGATFLVATGYYAHLFTSPMLKIQDMTPAWDLPMFPFMLSGTIASIGAEDQPPSHAVPMIVAGLTAQGLGMGVSVLMYAMYLHRMIQWGFPSPKSRPAMFIAVGPPSFTSLCLIGMANAFPDDTTYFGSDGKATLNMLRLLATMTAVFIWCIALWFFSIAILAVLPVAKTMKFHLNWWAFVFPNVGFTIATIKIGDSFQSAGVRWVGSTMTICVVATYLFVLSMNVRAVFVRQILFEGQDEDTYITENKPKQARRLRRKSKH